MQVVEQLHMTTFQERQHLLQAAGYNLFKLRAEDVLIDLLTDSGTGDSLYTSCHHASSHKDRHPRSMQTQLHVACGLRRPVRNFSSRVCTTEAGSHMPCTLCDLLCVAGAMSAEQWAGVMHGDESYAGAKSWFRFQAAVREVTGFDSVLPTHQGRGAERILFSGLDVKGKRIIANTHFDTTRSALLQSCLTEISSWIINVQHRSGHPRQVALLTPRHLARCHE